LKHGKANHQKTHRGGSQTSETGRWTSHDLGFKRSVFEAQLAALPSPERNGLEEVDFHFAPNPGEPSKPLRLTASER
jgi:DNA repair ATPase RecN